MPPPDPSPGTARGAPPAPEFALPLRAGPLRLVFDRGGLRWVHLAEREALRGVYFAVREPGWATVPGRLHGLVVEAAHDSFRIRFTARHARGPVAFDWEARIEGDAEGTLRFVASGVARSTFLRNRIGLCVLHPAAECAGEPCVVESVDGTRSRESFPRLVSPHQPFRRVRAIVHEVAPGVDLEVRLEGEVFETEDQRNWSDASFKTYSTPVDLPHPIEVPEGSRIRQSVTVRLHGHASSLRSEPVPRVPPLAVPTRKRNGTAPVVVTVDPESRLALPAVGLGGADGPALSPPQAGWLRSLGLAHLRADVRLDEDAWPEALQRAAANARLASVPLELALFLPDAADEALRRVAERAQAWRVPVASWLLFRSADSTTADGDASRARPVLTRERTTRLGGGTDSDFVLLNRRRPSVDGLDQLSFALSPQVHAQDDATLFENLESLGAMAETLREFAGRVELAVSPATLRPRHDSTPGASRDPLAPPLTDDPRQDGPLAAAWALGLVAAAAQAGIARLTLFEAAGARGVVGADRPFPTQGVLADLASSGTRVALATRSQRPERIQALALRSTRGVRLLLANVTRDPQPVQVRGLQGEARRAAPGGSGEGEPAGLELELEPHGLARLDVEAGA
jgi:hypothetical protein